MMSWTDNILTGEQRNRVNKIWSLSQTGTDIISQQCII